MQGKSLICFLLMKSRRSLRYEFAVLSSFQMYCGNEYLLYHSILYMCLDECVVLPAGHASTGYG